MRIYAEQEHRQDLWESHSGDEADITPDDVILVVISDDLPKARRRDGANRVVPLIGLGFFDRRPCVRRCKYRKQDEQQCVPNYRHEDHPKCPFEKRLVRFFAKQDQDKAHQRIDAQDIARPQQICVQQPDDEQPKQPPREKRRIRVAAFFRTCDLKRKTETEKERKDRIEFTLDQKMHEEVNYLVGQRRLCFKGRRHHSVTREPLHVPDQDPANRQAAKSVDNFDAFGLLNRSDLGLFHIRSFLLFRSQF